MKWIVLLAFFVLATPVSAYIDPGTGGAIIGSAGTIFAAFFGLIGVILLKYLINPIKHVIAKVRSGKKKEQ